MSNSSIRKLVLTLILTFGSLFSLSSYAWPEVDHMNMCGSAVTTARVYSGSFKGWQRRDSYVSRKSASGAYYRANCPGTSAPVAAPVRYVKPRTRYVKPRQVRRVVKRIRKVRRTKRVRRNNRGRYVTKCRYVKKCTKVRVNRRVKRRVVKRRYPYVVKSPKARRFKRTVQYNKRADCARVDRVNRSSWYARRD